MIHFEYYKNYQSIDGMLNGVACVSQAQAVQMCLELLGSRGSEVVAVMPVTSPPDILSGAIRAGTSPCLLDIHPTTLSFDPNTLKTVLENTKNVVVLLPNIGGNGIASNLQELLKDHVVILVNKELPTKDPIHGLETFSIFDFSMYIGNGAVIRTKYTKQLEDLIVNRDSALGFYNAIPYSSYGSITTLMDKDSYSAHSRMITSTYQKELYEFSVYLKASNTSNFLINVPNAFEVIDKLAMHDIESKLGCFPLYNLSEIHARFLEEDLKVSERYPVADKLTQEIVVLPTHLKISKETALDICRYIKELLNQ